MRLLIREYRNQAGLTVRRLSELSGVSVSQIVHLENGGCDALLSTLCKIARVLHMRPPDLVDWDDHWATEEGDEEKPRY